MMIVWIQSQPVASGGQNKFSEYTIEIPENVVVVQEKEDEADFPDLPSHGYVPLRMAPTEKEENTGSKVPNEEELLHLKE